MFVVVWFFSRYIVPSCNLASAYNRGRTVDSFRAAALLNTRTRAALENPNNLRIGSEIASSNMARSTSGRRTAIIGWFQDVQVSPDDGQLQTALIKPTSLRIFFAAPRSSHEKNPTTASALIRQARLSAFSLRLRGFACASKTCQCRPPLIPPAESPAHSATPACPARNSRSEAPSQSPKAHLFAFFAFFA